MIPDAITIRKRLLLASIIRDVLLFLVFSFLMLSLFFVPLPQPWWALMCALLIFGLGVTGILILDAILRYGDLLNLETI